jgi:hypothetical protein
MKSVSGRKQRPEGETFGKSERISVDSVCFAVKRELLEAVAGRNPRLNREFTSQFIIEINKCK